MGGQRHTDIAYDAASKAGFDDAGIAAGAAPEPDSWPADIPSWLPQTIKDYLQIVVHSVGHYYNPVLHYGAAPTNAENYANIARGYFLEQNTMDAAFNLGYAMHFIEDVSNPMHTGGEADQVYDYFYHPAGYPNMHDAYEAYVSSNWMSGYNFMSYAYNNYDFVSVRDPSDATGNLAAYTNQYCGTLIATISNHRDTFGSDPNVRAITQNCVIVEDAYLIGFALYVMMGY